jgi:hypothetical protein
MTKTKTKTKAKTPKKYQLSATERCRVALEAWQKAALAYRRYLDSPAASAPGADGAGGTSDRLYGRLCKTRTKLLDVVLGACCGESEGEPEGAQPPDWEGWPAVGVDIGDAILVYGVVLDDVFEEKTEHFEWGATVLIVPKDRIVGT